MIFKRYGTQLHSVEPNFDARAMNEIGFGKNGALSMAAEDFERDYEHVSTSELTAQAEGSVQTEAEQQTLRALRGQLDEQLAGLEAGMVIVVESEQGKDYPKLRERQSTLVVGTENRLHFERYIEPPLRLGIYKPRKR